jgi:hypothetical protein
VELELLRRERLELLLLLLERLELLLLRELLLL